MTEFSSLNWALYQMSEYVNMMTMSAFISTLFLGGWRGPAFLNNIIPGMAEWPFIWLIAKMAIFMIRSEEHTSELQSRGHFACRLLLAKKNIVHFYTNLF